MPCAGVIGCIMRVPVMWVMVDDTGAARRYGLERTWAGRGCREDGERKWCKSMSCCACRRVDMVQGRVR